MHALGDSVLAVSCFSGVFSPCFSVACLRVLRRGRLGEGGMDRELVLVNQSRVSPWPRLGRGSQKNTTVATFMAERARAGRMHVLHRIEEQVRRTGERIGGVWSAAHPVVEHPG